VTPPSRILVEGFDDRALAAVVRRAGERTVRFLRCPRVRVNIYGVSPETARAINLAFRKRKGPAGILSFALPGSDPEGERGEILLCVGTVRRLAAERSKTLKAMLSELAVHGMLHVLGFHHGSPGEEIRMAALQRAIGGKISGGRG